MKSITLLPFLFTLVEGFLNSPGSSWRRRVPHRHHANTNDRVTLKISTEEQLKTEQEEDVSVTDATKRGQLTAYQILDPYLFSSQQPGTDVARPLGAVLGVLHKTLEQINQKDMEFVLEYVSTIKVLRIEHTISHTVDPLCWLHAQTNDQPPAVYFSNAEQTLEAAAYGAAHIHHGAANDALFQFCQELPPDCHMYGGERFDREMQPDDEDWSEFGIGFWMLPMLELRRKRTQDNQSITTLAIHVLRNEDDTAWATEGPLSILSQVTESISEAAPPTTLPPVISRDGTYGPELDSQELYEKGVTAALEKFKTGGLEKVVLARRNKLLFDKAAYKLSALNVLRKWKFGGNEGGHLFYLRPVPTKEFFGCTPEQLFSVGNGKLVTEALAGTRPRGSTQEADMALSQDLFQSPKDRSENEITGRFIRNQLEEAASLGLTKPNDSIRKSDDGERYFVRRLLHLQHICQRFECELEQGVAASRVAKFFLHGLHPTPAVCGFPFDAAKQFIRDKESIGFDRGFYAGPFGYIGTKDAEIVVAIRSGLLEKPKSNKQGPTLSVYAGAGIVPGSTVQGEWAETSYKLNVVSTLFPQSPITLLSAATPNVAWASAFIEELIRCGVRQFYVCPGSRSTPLVFALAKALRSNVGIIQAQSVHDERGAAFRAVGYARGTGRPAVVITSSGTATANLYPAIMEAGMDGVPLLIVTADRPYESRDSGANQAVDQVKAYSSTYVRWFRDIPPPSDDVPISVALSDANHGYRMAIKERGPVHLNVQFRENLAPDTGAIRNDDRVDSITKFNGFRFTDVPNFARWSNGGDQWLNDPVDSYAGVSHKSIAELARMIRESKRGIIVVGNLRMGPGEPLEDQVAMISDFANFIGFPVFAGIQSGSLRSQFSGVIPFAEHILKNPMVAQNIQPDLILQIGHPLISSEVPKLIRESMRAAESTDNGGVIHHVLIHPHHSLERSDPDFTLTHRFSTQVLSCLASVMKELEATCDVVSSCSSELTPLVLLGRMLAQRIPEIIERASISVSEELLAKSNADSRGSLTEPQVILAMTRALNKSGRKLPLFLSNSMPVRDAEFFLYSQDGNDFGSVGVNRGASGIDGIISTAAGYAEGSDEHTTLLIGDLATLHDLNSFHGMSTSQSNPSKRSPPITAVVVNNDGGGIFSFLPVARHGKDVNFEEFFGTPTNAFSFEKGAEAFGLPFERANSITELEIALDSSIRSSKPRIIEANVVGRDVNVAVHREITSQTNKFITATLESAIKNDLHHPKLPIKMLSSSDIATESISPAKTLILLHGWMGDKSEWYAAGIRISELLPSGWSVIAVDLEGHGQAHTITPEMTKIVKGLDLGHSTRSINDVDVNINGGSIDSVAKTVLRSLSEDHDIKTISAVAGYSLGGRVALAMNRLCKMEKGLGKYQLMTDDTRIILLGSHPGSFGKVDSSSLRSAARENRQRVETDKIIAKKLRVISNRAVFEFSSPSSRNSLWSGFLQEWYEALIWGDMKTRKPGMYRSMLGKRATTLSTRADEVATILEQCSAGANANMEWMMVDSAKVLFLCGELDTKYVRIGNDWMDHDGEVSFISIPEAGHALLLEAPETVADHIVNFIEGSEIRSELNETALDERIYRRKLEEVFSFVSGKDSTVSSGTQKTTIQDVVSTSSSTVNFTNEVRNRQQPASLGYESFAIEMTNNDRNQKGVVGIGWGENAKLSESNRIKQRLGFILQIVSDDGSTVGVGEVSPLGGLHPESLDDARIQLERIKKQMEGTDVPTMDATEILKLEGGLDVYITKFLHAMQIESLSLSVRSGLEMAFLSFGSHALRKPVLTCLSQYASRTNTPAMLSLNGLIARSTGSSTLLTAKEKGDPTILYDSLKVKVGHQDASSDARSLSMALQQTNKLRPDANRAWTEADALQFAKALDGLDVNVIDRIEFVEEPLVRCSGTWSLRQQIQSLERWYQHSGIRYGLDESIADLVMNRNGNFDLIRNELIDSFVGVHGCAALVLKPALLGLELSMRIAKVAHDELGINAVFSCSFDSGVGLSYTAFIAAASDMASGRDRKDLLAHGIGTFSMLEGDTLSPSFGSYVNENGILQVASLSRAFFGLGLDEMRGSFPSQLPEEDMLVKTDDEYCASAATSSSGREIRLVVSLPLPFSDDIASSRFTDLPQQSRWSPWLSSVAYLDAGRETEWTLNIRGVRLSWRAISTIIHTPHKGIQWESISGLKNMGIVEFIPTTPNECMMKVRMTIVAPRIVSTLFPGASVFLEDFLQNKLLKWSLEMFRDVVKGDLALERGDVELGDALFGAVEGKANAIEATLSNPSVTGKDVNG